MKKKFAIRSLVAGILTSSFAVLSFSALTIAWFLGPNIDTEDDKYLHGSIGLRNYFFSGDGSQENPYEIVTPIHFYNLTRLQNLGIFPGKMYFQIGHMFDIDGVPSLRCIDSYDSEGNPIFTKYLDMEDFCERTMVKTIGGEGTPFVGTINGNGLPIKNLTVYGNPEDIGVFGYVAHTGKLEGMVFDNLKVVSLGYNNNVGDDDNTLFSEDIDDIFNSASYLATDTSLSFYEWDSSIGVSGGYKENYLKKLNGSTGTPLDDINSDSHVIDGGHIYNGYFHATFPEGTRFTYSLESSSPLIKPIGDLDLDGSSPEDLIIDMTELDSSAAFNSGKLNQVNARIYLVASVQVDGYIFSRVIQTYTVEFYSKGYKYEDKQFDATIFCDYVDQGIETDHNTGYHHGNNIGLIAGHVDGSLNHCYVFNGQFQFNETGYHPVAAESQTALVGEIGKNVSNIMDPDLALVVHGDIGVMNFSKIYGMIRRDTVNTDTIYAGQRGSLNYVTYGGNMLSETYTRFSEYLRYADTDENQYIVKTGSDMSSYGVWGQYNFGDIPTDFNSVDFLWNKVIEDEDEVDRGLGVFKVVSSYNEKAARIGQPGSDVTYGQCMVENLGDCRIINGTPKTKVYFSTAEYDNQKGGEFIASRASTIPSYFDAGSFGTEFERDFNYVFELDLEHMNDAGGNNYMYNTDSDFLAAYLKNKLIDKYGAPIEAGSPRFGFMFRSSENETLASLSSYMPVFKPGDKKPFTNAKGETHYYPSNSIVFHIDNDNGANVSVVGKNANITVYSYDPTKLSGGTKALYTMKSGNVNSIDSHRYFTYDVATGETGTETVQNGSNMSDNGALYGHIFKLEKGDYVLGAASGEAHVYFLAVQGQTDGTIDTNDIITLDDAIENVDFLLEAPTYDNFPNNLNKALFSFNATFNTTSGTVTMDVVTSGDKKYMRIAFATSPTFVTYVLTYSRNTEHIYYINGDLYDEQSHKYLPS